VLDTKLGNLFPTQRLHELLDADCMPEDQLLLVFASFCVILCHSVSFFILDFFLVSASLCFGFLAQIFAQQDSVDTQDEDRVRDSVPLTPCPTVCTMSTSSMASGVGSLPYSLSDLADLDEPPEKRSVQSQRLNKELTKHRHFETSSNMTKVT